MASGLKWWVWVTSHTTCGEIVQFAHGHLANEITNPGYHTQLTPGTVDTAALTAKKDLQFGN